MIENRGLFMENKIKEESGLKFLFPQNDTVVKFDDTKFYRDYFNKLPEAKGVDFISVDKDKMSSWVEDFCLKYKTVGKTRSFKSHTGEILQVSGGDYGWQIDYSQTVDQIYNAITAESKEADVTAYLNKQSNENSKKLITKLEPIYKNKAYKMNYENPEEDYNTQTYSEVDISEQMVYVFQNGQVVYSAKCVTGLPSDATRSTKTGCWYIKDKKLEYTLTGADYKTPTKYWIRITCSGSKNYARVIAKVK